MNKFNLLLGSFMAIFFIALSTTTSFAGGGGVDFRVLDIDGDKDPHIKAVRAYFDPKLFTCKGMSVLMNFTEPQPGDEVNGVDGNNVSTITEGPSYETINGQQYLRCSTYLKVYSARLIGDRNIHISFIGDNLEGERIITVNFGPRVRYEQSAFLPWETPTEATVSTPPSYKPADTIITTPAIQEVPGKEDKVKELSEKVTDLQNQLNESKQKQNILEQRISELVEFIKKLFPFFN